MNRTPKVCYIICSSPRSGSHLYSSILASTGIAGNPDDYFNPWGAGQRHGEDVESLLYDAEYVSDLISRGTTPNNVFGTNAHFNQITSFVGLGSLERIFPVELKYIYLERQDELRQGVSLAIARQTNQFNWNQPAKKEPVYNPEQIRCCLEEIMTQKKGWKTYFFENDIHPFKVFYEDLVSKPAEIIMNTLNYLNIYIPEKFFIPESPFKKQSTELNDEWLLKYKTAFITI